MASVRFLTDLGADVLVPVKGDNAVQVKQAVLRALREFGRLGWRSGDPPRGGFRFSLANEPDFDWRLVGARRGTVTVNSEERQGVWHAGYFYTRRELEANPRMNLGAAVKYSRGAKNTDPADLVEEGEGAFRYVTLAVFRGEGRRREEYAIPAAARSGDSRTAEVAP